MAKLPLNPIECHVLCHVLLEWLLNTVLISASGTCGQSSKIFSGLWDRFVKELDEDRSGGDEVDGDVEEHDRPPLDVALIGNSCQIWSRSGTMICAIVLIIARPF